MTNSFWRNWRKKVWPSFSRPLRFHSLSLTVLSVLISLVLYGLSFFHPLSPFLVVPAFACVLWAGTLVHRYRKPFFGLPAGIAFLAFVTAGADAAAVPALRLFCFPGIVLPALLLHPIQGLILTVLGGAAAVWPPGPPVESATIAAAAAACGLSVIWVTRRRRARAERTEGELLELRTDLETVNTAGQAAHRMGLLEEEPHSEPVTIATELRKKLDEIIDFVKNAVPCNTAIYLASTEAGLLVKSHRSETPPLRFEPVPTGSGLLATVFSRHESRMTGTVSSNRRRPAYYVRPVPVRSLLAVPVLDEERLLGILAVDSLEENAFFDRDREMLELVARQITSRIRDTGALHESGERARAIRTLYRVDSELLGRMKYPELPRALVEAGSRIAVASFCALFRLDRGKYRLDAHEGDADVGKKRLFTGRDAPLLSWIVTHRQPHHVTDLKARPMEALPFEVPGLRSFLGFPMTLDEEVLGVFVFGSHRPDAFDGRSVESLRYFVINASIYLANALLHRKVKEMAQRDGLTGLYNHQNFQESLARQFELIGRFPEPMTVLLIDVDHFKKVNDTYGHPAGDAVLRGVAKIVNKALRSVDIAARYGGEEFAAILIKTDRRGAFRMAERLRRAIEQETFETPAGPVRITASIGSATFPGDADNGPQLVEQADEALYNAKRNGRNRVCAYSPENGPKPETL